MDNNNKIRVPASLLLNPVHLLSLGFGSGLSPKMPGTMGTLVGVGLYNLFAGVRWEIYLAIVITALISGIFMCTYTAKALQVHDHPAIVWDEIVGYFVSLFMVPKDWLWVGLAFILFRFFDILKPWPISLLDKTLKGGFGIMLDDLVAGFFTLIIIQIILYLV